MENINSNMHDEIKLTQKHLSIQLKINRLSSIRISTYRYIYIYIMYLQVGT